MISLFFGGTVFGDMLIDTHTHIYNICIYEHTGIWMFSTMGGRQ